MYRHCLIIEEGQLLATLPASPLVDGLALIIVLRPHFGAGHNGVYLHDILRSIS